MQPNQKSRKKPIAERRAKVRMKSELISNDINLISEYLPNICICVCLAQQKSNGKRNVHVLKRKTNEGANKTAESKRTQKPNKTKQKLHLFQQPKQTVRY